MDRSEGQPLKKKISSSLVEPSTLWGYESAFARNANETGWLDITKGGAPPNWQRRWFELKNGVIRYAPSAEDKDIGDSVFIPIENIIRLVIDKKKNHHNSKSECSEATSSEHLITMKTTHEKLILRADTNDDLHRWVFAFQRSVALAMTKIKMAQSNIALQHSRGVGDDFFKQHQQDEALYLQEAAANEDDGWETRLTRARSILHGHANAIAKARQRQHGKGPRSLSIDDTVLPTLAHQAHDHQTGAIPRVPVVHYFEGSTGRKTPPFSTPTSPMKICWGNSQSGSKTSGNSPVGSTDNSPRALGVALPDVQRGSSTGSSCSSGSGSNGAGASQSMGQSSDGINSTWRSVDDMCIFTTESTSIPDPRRGVDCKDKMSPSSYSVGRTRSTSSGSGSGVLSATAARKDPHSPSRERSSSLTGERRPSHTSDDGDFGGGYLFSMEDGDSLENSLEDFTAFCDTTTKPRGPECGVSPLTSYMTKCYNLRMEFGACTKIGPKSSQEDRFVMTPDLNIPLKRYAEVEGYDDDSNTYRCENAYAAVYDGHCGAQASTYVNETLHGMIFQHAAFNQDIESAIRDSCIQIDKLFLDRARREDIYAGTTAIGAFFHPKISQNVHSSSYRVDVSSNNAGSSSHLHSSSNRSSNEVRESNTRMTVFNIGDSRAVLCRNGVAISMSEAHSPSRPDEQSRIEAAKGWITEEKELFVGRLHRMDLNDPDIADQAANDIQWTTIYRVLGEVSVSRSIGDYPYKGFVPGEVVTDFFSWPDNHDMTFNADLVISDPESKYIDIDSLCEFVILASDGLWDVVSNEKAVARVKGAFEEGKSPKTAAEELCNLALKLGSGDNTTVIIVQFYHNMNEM